LALEAANLELFNWVEQRGGNVADKIRGALGTVVKNEEFSRCRLRC
jgi:hypothetical protein